jgi:predicted ester cyclase
MGTVTEEMGREVGSVLAGSAGSEGVLVASPLEIVLAYASAKSSGDIDGALATCHPAAVIETLAFQAVSRSAGEARVQFRNFLSAFPDYKVNFSVLKAADDMVFSSGSITGTMQGPLAGIAPTGRSFELPFSCHWVVREGLIVNELFFYDFYQLCDQLGIDVNEAARHFRYWRANVMGRNG